MLYQYSDTRSIWKEKAISQMRRGIFTAACLLLPLLMNVVSAQGLKLRDPYIEGFHPLDEEPYNPSPLNAQEPVLLKLNTKMFKDTSRIDFEKRQITFSRVDPLGYTMWEFHYDELSDYLASRNRFSLYKSWKAELGTMKAVQDAGRRKGMKLEWELPVQYPTWAQRVLGKEPPKLSIDGFLELTVGYTNTKYDDRTPTDRYQDNHSFNFDINYSFGITGSVGRLINLNIRADKEQNFDISDNLKNFKVEYKESTPGELEDEIIQEVIVGYTGFQMPGTQLSGYSESHEGLFGIKIKSQLGPLQLTTIASTEQGQSNKKTYSSSGSETSRPFSARDILWDRYFFLDNFYRKAYTKKYAPGGAEVEVPKVTEFSVWRSFGRTYTDQQSNIKEVKIDDTEQRPLFERLERDRHYYLDESEGWIRFNDTVNFQPNQEVAIFMRTEDSLNADYRVLQKGGKTFGTRVDSITGETVADTLWHLWVLRPRQQIEIDDTTRFFLMWRHVYEGGDFEDKAAFKLTVRREEKDNTEKIEINTENNRYYAEILGLSDENNKPKIATNYIYNTQFNDLIIPPYNSSDSGLEVFNNETLGEEFLDGDLYRYSRNSLKTRADENSRSFFTLEMSGSQKKTTFDDLGWGIMKGTEIVKADGMLLDRDRDYTINYDMGVLDLISARAKAAEKVDIEYQSEALFIPERKMFLGTHGRVDLPFITDKSYAGASILFQSTESNDDIPRIDQEPYNKMLFDINTHLEFEPEWMTELVNALPLVETQAGSSVKFDLEFAHSRVNPNKAGKAYIDDFEDSKQSDLLSNSYKSWYRASPPVSADSLYYYPPAWDFYWFSPRDQDELNRIKRDDIIELSDAEKKASQLGTNYEYVLRLHATPAPSEESLEGRFKKAWAGIMTPVSQSFANKEQMQFFEFFVKADGGFDKKGTLKLQMGEMREDISLDGGPPNGFDDREDTAQIVQTQTYDPNLDKGWDRLPDTLETYFIPADPEYLLGLVDSLSMEDLRKALEALGLYDSLQDDGTLDSLDMLVSQDKLDSLYSLIALDPYILDNARAIIDSLLPRDSLVQFTFTDSLDSLHKADSLDSLFRNDSLALLDSLKGPLFRGLLDSAGLLDELGLDGFRDLLNTLDLLEFCALLYSYDLLGFRNSRSIEDLERSQRWVALKYGDPLLGSDSLDPAKDNFKQYFYDAGDVRNYRYACRHQLDGEIAYSEDINYDGTVQTAIEEKYFQYSIDLSDDRSPFIDTTVNYSRPGEWRKYRIPLHEIIPGYEDVLDTINRPTWRNITTVRLIWTDFDSTRLDKEQQMIFYNMEFVGNQWIEVSDTSSRVKMRSSVVNTKEDKNYEDIWERYKGLITRERDEYGYEIEQSLRLNFVNLADGDTALVRKSFQYQTLNLSAYEELSLLVFGKDTMNTPLDQEMYSRDIRFVFRFGTDDSTYYEYSRYIYPEWNNVIRINLKDLSNLKDQFMISQRDSAIEISNGTLRVHAPKSRQPNFARIQWMAIGVIRDGNRSGVDSLSGEIWVNEMKLVGIRNINGWASRADFSTQFADLLSFQARMDYENGNFRRMTETQNLPDNTQVTGSMGASIGLEKFLPGEWGLSLPAGITYNSSIMRPQLKNQTDVYLVDEKGNPDGFIDIVKDAATGMVGIEQKHNDTTRSERYQTSTVGRTYYTGYKKNNHADNPLVSLVADRWSADARYSTTISEVRYGNNPTRDSIYARRDTNDVYSGKVQYDLTPYQPPEWLKWKPFKSVSREWFPDRIKKYEFTLLPKKLTVDVADINFNKKKQVDTWRGVRDYQNAYTVRHNITYDYTPLSPLVDMDYSIGINRDLIEVAGEDNLEKGKKIFERNETWSDYMILWGEKDRTQRASLNLSPRFTDWLTTSANYASDYRSSVVQWLKKPEPLLHTTVKSALSLNGSLNIGQLLGDLKNATEKKALGGLFEMMDKGVDQIGLRQISLTYSATSDLKNNYVSDSLLHDQDIDNLFDMLKFQLGVKGRTPLDILTGDMDDTRYLGMRSRNDSIYTTRGSRYYREYERSEYYRNDTRMIDRSLRLSTGIDIKPLSLSFRQMSLSFAKTMNLYPDSTRNDTTVTFPDASVSFSTQLLNKIDLVKQALQSLNLNSSFTYRETNRWTSAQVNGSNRSVKLDLMPLFSLSGTLKRWPVRIDYRHNYSKEINTKLSEKGEVSDTNKLATRHADEISVDYEIKRSSKLTEIKLLTWTIPIKGRTTIGLKFERSAQKEKVNDVDDKSFSLIPKISYIFTDNVTGRFEFTIRQQDKGGKKTNSTDFALIVKINF